MVWLQGDATLTKYTLYRREHLKLAHLVLLHLAVAVLEESGYVCVPMR